MITIVDRSMGAVSEKGQDIAKGNGDYLVETSGYIPKETQLQMLLQSGEALDRYYKKLFPGYEPPNSSDPEFDPTAQKGYDFFDWHEDVVFVRNQLTEQERRMKVEAIAELETKPQELPPAPAGGNEGAGQKET